jgi:hypothetical protein
MLPNSDGITDVNKLEAVQFIIGHNTETKNQELLHQCDNTTKNVWSVVGEEQLE